MWKLKNIFATVLFSEDLSKVAEPDDDQPPSGRLLTDDKKLPLSNRERKYDSGVTIVLRDCRAHKVKRKP